MVRERLSAGKIEIENRDGEMEHVSRPSSAVELVGLLVQLTEEIERVVSLGTNPRRRRRCPGPRPKQRIRTATAKRHTHTHTQVKCVCVFKGLFAICRWKFFRFFLSNFYFFKLKDLIIPQYI